MAPPWPRRRQRGQRLRGGGEAPGVHFQQRIARLGVEASAQLGMLRAFGRLDAGAVSKHDRTYFLTEGGEYARYPFIQFGTVTYAHSSTGGGTTIVTQYRSGATKSVTPGNVSVQPGDVLVFRASGVSSSFSPRVQFTTSGEDIFPIGGDWAGYTSVNAAP